jgi:hypothetical protein
MNTYKINWSRSDYGYILMTGKNEQEALEKFRQGNYKDNDMEIKGGETVDESIELLDDVK